MACPTCGSGEIVYSCSPACCFNHVCADCRTTFEPATAVVSGKPRPAAGSIVPPDPLPDCTEPTAACARCESTAVYAAASGELVCGACGTWLTLELTEIAPG
ncbi:MAG: hypothetical protein FJW31_25530 [Acidobacteria bacterium]|nr:hypothetical protein [Acidobacteriota bacterium]